MNELTVRPDQADTGEIDLLDLFYYIRQRLLFLIIAFILGAVLAAAGSYFLIEPTYEASSEIYIVSASNDSVVNLSDLQIGASLTSDYESLVTSRPMMESVLQELGLDYSVNGLRSMIKITNPDGTRILKITVTTSDPDMSARIANEVASLAIDWLPSVMECEPPNIVEDAIPSTQKAGPNIRLYTALGAFAALVIALIVCCVQYLLNDSIRSAEDLERYFGLTPLASIPEDHSEPNLHLIKDAAKKRSRKKSIEVSEE